MSVATGPWAVYPMLSPSSDFELKLVRTLLGSRVSLAIGLAFVAPTSSTVIGEVTPNDASTDELFHTVLMLPSETAVPPGISVTPGTSPATWPTFS
jgi:hypothetical protein